jgi:ribosome-associated toxin RatA of RatAB toxin-antitoxin module
VRYLVLVFILTVVSSASPPAAGATVGVSVRPDGDAIVIEASALLKGNAPTAWRVLTDYDRYSDFIPGLQSSRVVARRGPMITVEQSGYAPLWLLRMPLDITYEITEFPPYRVQSKAAASVLRELNSSYLLTPTACGVRLDYAGRLAPRSALFGRFEQLAVQQSVVREFQALADEIERSSLRCETSC